jgi:hypothetical protein
VDDLLVIAQAASTHWKYSLHANRLLSSMVRRDEVRRPDLEKELYSFMEVNVFLIVAHQCSSGNTRCE